MTAGASSLAPGSMSLKNISAQACDRFELFATYSLLIFYLLQMPETRQPRELLAAHAKVLRPRRIWYHRSSHPRITSPDKAPVRVTLHGFHYIAFDNRRG